MTIKEEFDEMPIEKLRENAYMFYCFKLSVLAFVQKYENDLGIKYPQIIINELRELIER